MKARAGSIRVTIGASWWEMSVVNGKSAPWLIWRRGHTLPECNQPGFRIDINIGSTGTCLQEAYVRVNRGKQTLNEIQ